MAWLLWSLHVSGVLPCICFLLLASLFNLVLPDPWHAMCVSMQCLRLCDDRRKHVNAAFRFVFIFFLDLSVRRSVPGVGREESFGADGRVYVGSVEWFWWLLLPHVNWPKGIATKFD